MMSPNHEKAPDGDTNVNNGLRKGTWSLEEDEILAAYVKEHGEGNWKEVQKNSGLARCGKSCRFRWLNHLKPDLKKGSFSKEEQEKIFQLYSKFGPKWCKMAPELPGRTDNEIKNFWNTRKRKAERAGLPPLYPQKPKELNDNKRRLNDFSGNQVDVSPVSDINENKNSKEDLSVLMDNTNQTLINRGLDETYIPSEVTVSVSDLPPLPPCIEELNGFSGNQVDVSPVSDINENRNSKEDPSALIDNTNQTLINQGLDETYIPSEVTVSVSDLPPFPPCIEHQNSGRFTSPNFLDDDFFLSPLWSPTFRPHEETQSEPVSPGRSCLLESIYKDLDVLDVGSCSSMHCNETRLEDQKGKLNYIEEDDITKKRELIKDFIDMGWLDKEDLNK